MASIRREIPIAAMADLVWAVVRDVGEVHRRLVPGIVVDCRLENGARIVTFANGAVVRELIVEIDDAALRFVYAATGGRTTHHNASIEVVAESDTACRLVWITDLLPDAVTGAVAALVEQGAAVMKATLESECGARE